MNYKKIQTEMFKQMLSTGKIKGAILPDGRHAFTSDNYRMFVIPKEIFCLDYNKVDYVSPPPSFEIHDNDRELKISNDLRIMNGGRIARKLVCKDGECLEGEITEMWVNNKFLEPFVSPTLHAYNSVNRILVFEPGKAEPCAILLPLRV